MDERSNPSHHRRPKLTVYVNGRVARFYIKILNFVWELLDQVVYKTFYGNPLDFSKINDIVMNGDYETKLTKLPLV